jgi:Flp pilus assembly protein TadD
LGNPSLVAFILNTHGYIAFQRGEWRQAREEYGQAITLLRQAKLPWGATYSLINLGTLLMVEDQWESAAPYFEEALAAAEQKHEWAPLRSAQCGLAERDLLFGQPQRAYDRLAPLLVGLEQQESGLEDLLTMLAWAHLERGEPDQTRYLLDQVLPNATRHHLRPILVRGLSVQARLEARCGNWQEATQALDEALRLARTIEHPYAEAKVLHTAGCLLLQQEEPAHAYESFTQALAMLNRLGERLYARQIEQALATLEEAEIGHHATL